MEERLPLVVWSHLRWNFVFQRPQHVMTRLARRRRVLFVEEPVAGGETAPRWQITHPAPGATVATPALAVGGHGFDDAQTAVLAPLVAHLLADEDARRHVAWLYTPMALPLALLGRPAGVVYDCMDELSAFANAPRALLDRERKLLEVADLVFTGGPSLYRAKRDRHRDVHCFPSSVDVAHFRQALGDAPEPPDQAGLPRPRLGFFGVIDERLDRDVVAALAEAHPDWQVVMIGPVMKIDPASLPRRANLHYLGGRAYGELPRYLGGWDVALLPFARNEATRFISPTKTLEYMAAERPIVSTRIADVAEPYGDVVYLGDGPAEFVTACERALRADEEERRTRIEAMRRVLAKTSWDRTVVAMEGLLDRLGEPVRRATRPLAVAAGVAPAERSNP